jgi:CheY-like chemotaxis protein
VSASRWAYLREQDQSAACCSHLSQAIPSRASSSAKLPARVADMWQRSPIAAEPDIEALRKKAKILVIDDHAFPSQRLFERDGYHFERWAQIRNLSQLTDGHYDVILLDVQGVGLNESPELQGLGILSHIKQSNPSQIVIVYTAQPQKISMRTIIEMADDVLDKDASYVEYKEAVDKLLRIRSTPGYFIAVINRELGPRAALVPKVVPKALRAFGNGSSRSLEAYLKKNLPDAVQIDRILTIVSIAITVFSMIKG